MIDVIDVAIGIVVISQQFPGRTLRLVSSEFASEVRGDADSTVVLDSARIEIRRP